MDTTVWRLPEGKGSGDKVKKVNGDRRVDLDGEHIMQYADDDYRIVYLKHSVILLTSVTPKNSISKKIIILLLDYTN